jgi:hypothetical protein
MFCKQNVVDTFELQHEIIRLHFWGTLLLHEQCGLTWWRCMVVRC